MARIPQLKGRAPSTTYYEEVQLWLRLWDASWDVLGSLCCVIPIASTAYHTTIQAKTRSKHTATTVMTRSDDQESAELNWRRFFKT
jgi:hypothetical protein